MTLATVHVHELEPGSHISKKIVRRDVFEPKHYEIPDDECMETRPDWGVYKPIKTLPALERALRKRGAFNGILDPNQVFYFGFDD